MIKLKPRQIEFVTALKNAGLGTELSFAEMQEVCDSTGIYKMPPSWITHDSDRKVSRGVYAIPEIEDIPLTPKSAVSTPAPVIASVNPAIEEVAQVVQGAVEQTVSSVDMTLGMTGGERDSLVPEKFAGYVKWGHYNDIKKIIKSRQNVNVFVTGLSGNGKTLMVEQVCADLGRECFRVNITCQTDEDDLLGGFRLINGNTVWQDGPVTLAMKSGAVLLLDEVDLAGKSIMCLQSVLEGKGVFLKKIGQWVKPAQGFTILATANTKGRGDETGKFSGTGILNEAFLERFPFTMEQPYATVATERKILTKSGCEDVEFANLLCQWADAIRKTYLDDGVDDVISTRRLVNIVEAYKIFGKKDKAMELCLSRFCDESKEVFTKLYAMVDESMNPTEDSDESAAGTVSAEGNACPF